MTNVYARILEHEQIKKIKYKSRLNDRSLVRMWLQGYEIENNKSGIKKKDAFNGLFILFCKWILELCIEIRLNVNKIYKSFIFNSAELLFNEYFIFIDVELN